MILLYHKLYGFHSQTFFSPKPLGGKYLKSSARGSLGVGRPFRRVGGLYSFVKGGGGGGGRSKPFFWEDPFAPSNRGNCL